jgi:hypothetical protein
MITTGYLTRRVGTGQVGRIPLMVVTWRFELVLLVFVEEILTAWKKERAYDER